MFNEAEMKTAGKEFSFLEAASSAMEHQSPSIHLLLSPDSKIL